MNIKRALKTSPLTRSIYPHLSRWRDIYRARKWFRNPDVYLRALDHKGAAPVTLKTRDGLNLIVRQNLWDARIVREIFMGTPYTKGLSLPHHPVVVDIGGYIGDFSVYAAKYLKAPKVIVYEPTAENFAILQQNIAANGYEQTIIAVNKGVSDRNESVLNVEKSESEEMHASVYWYEQGEKRTIPCDTMQQIFDTHKLNRVDLLKVDCEGGEYDIFPSMSDDLYSRIANIVFEYHTINGSDAKLTAILARLRSLGFDVTVKDEIVTARAVTI